MMVAPATPWGGDRLVMVGVGSWKLNPMDAVPLSPVVVVTTCTELDETRPFFGQVVGSGAGLVMIWISVPLTATTVWATETFGLVNVKDTATGPSKPEPKMVSRVPPR